MGFGLGVFWVCWFLFNLNECEICLFWHRGSACPHLTIEDTHAVHQQECSLAWLVTLHPVQLAIPCSEISCAVIFLLQKILCWWNLKSSWIKMDRNTLPCWMPGRLHGRVVQNFRSEEGRQWSWESHGENYLPTSFILRSIERSE